MKEKREYTEIYEKFCETFNEDQRIKLDIVRNVYNYLNIKYSYIDRFCEIVFCVMEELDTIDVYLTSKIVDNFRELVGDLDFFDMEFDYLDFLEEVRNNL